MALQSVSPRKNRERGNIMKNLSISKKLLVGFGTVLALMLLSIILSLASISSVGRQVELYGKYTVPNNDSLWSMRRDMLSVQRYVLSALNSNNAQKIQEALDLAQEDGQYLLDTLDIYSKNQRNTDRDEEINEVRALLEKAGPIRQEIAELVLTGTEENLKKANDLFENQYIMVFDEAANILVDFSNSANEYAAQQKTDAINAQNMAWILLIVCAVVSIVLTAAAIIAIVRSILNPVKEIVSAYDEISKGNMQVEINYESRDEIGQMAMLIQKTNRLQSTIIKDVIEKFSKISQGDLQIQVDLDYPGDFIALKQTIEKTVSNLNHTMQTINLAAEQVSTGSEQVSSGAQALAAGSTEQASSVEELTVSITNIAEQAEQNSLQVTTATQFVEQAGAGVNSGNEHMKQLIEAMGNIGSSSNQIVNITKVIEDIAFQTNILALNAAIEAARAGNAGKGFAVVADEVRNLAAKSAEAAKQTAELIQASVLTVAEGSQISAQTAQILKDVGEKTIQVVESITKIQQASAEQTMAIEQIKQGLSQVSAVVQTNAATAEENSATSEEMSAQAVTLREEVGKFKLNKGYVEDRTVDISLVNELPREKDTLLDPVSGLGKY